VQSVESHKTLRRNIPPPSSRSKKKLITCFHAGVSLVIFFDPEDRGDMFLRNVGWLLMDYTAVCHRKWYIS
jgi:hypothetical protein